MNNNGEEVINSIDKKELLIGKLFSINSVINNLEVIGEIPKVKTLVRKAIKVAWPSTVESFLVAMVSFIDTIMVSSLGSYAIAAVGLTTQPKFLCLTLFISLNIAVSSVVARRKGENDRKRANNTLFQALIITGVLSIIISALAMIFAEPFLRFAGSQSDTHIYAVTYFRVIMGGLIFNVISLVINAAQRGCGNTKIAMRTNLASNFVNIIFNYLLIGGKFGFPALGVAGAAIATVLGTMVAFVMSIYSISHSDGFLYIKSFKKNLNIDKNSLKSLFSVGASSFVEQIFMRTGFLLYSLIIANLGTSAFAAHQIGMNIINISFSLGDGLAVAGVALIGQNLGKKRPDLAKIYGSICRRIGLMASIMISIIYAILGKDIFKLFTNDPDVLKYSFNIMNFVIIIVIFQIAQAIYGGCLRGAGDTKYTAIVSLISITFVRPSVGWLLTYPLSMGLIGAWFGILTDQIVRFCLTSRRFKSGKWTEIKI
ncbi:MATE family efflux transporter [Clostridium sp. NSJ-6]|uniref:Probable multidrug resistance protein NorM n=1 Tax=Clostridium hominis TaxID=2763036 RepID=A0ABR7DG82_9CLOT|nr:MATE family efflux transporter [Clostridium hominis]MBC5630420.1 MATE family efflux transporter [Clostridium hominis]